MRKAKSRHFLDMLAEVPDLRNSRVNERCVKFLVQDLRILACLNRGKRGGHRGHGRVFGKISAFSRDYGTF